MNKFIKTVKDITFIFIKWVFWMIEDLYEYIKNLFKIEIK